MAVLNDELLVTAFEIKLYIYIYACLNTEDICIINRSVLVFGRRIAYAL